MKRFVPFKVGYFAPKFARQVLVELSFHQDIKETHIDIYISFESSLSDLSTVTFKNWGYGVNLSLRFHQPYKISK